MNPENTNLTPLQENNEDLQFDRTNTSTTDTQASTDNEKVSDENSTGSSKEEELASNNFPPLTEEEKQPKLQGDEQISEMNRKTSIGD